MFIDNSHLIRKNELNWTWNTHCNGLFASVDSQWTVSFSFRLKKKKKKKTKKLNRNIFPSFMVYVVKMQRKSTRNTVHLNVGCLLQFTIIIITRGYMIRWTCACLRWTLALWRVCLPNTGTCITFTIQSLLQMCSNVIIIL